MLRRPFGVFGDVSPWREMERIQRLMDRMLYDAFSLAGGRVGPVSGYPAMNVWANDEGAVITAELPGVDADDINIAVAGDTLTLSGQRKGYELNKDEKFHRRERSFGKFTRTIQLPFKVNADKVEALFKNGVLHISIPRAEADKPKKITVKGA